jgi:hypothetical protein
VELKVVDDPVPDSVEVCWSVWVLIDAVVDEFSAEEEAEDGAVEDPETEEDGDVVIDAALPVVVEVTTVVKVASTTESVETVVVMDIVVEVAGVEVTVTTCVAVVSFPLTVVVETSTSVETIVSVCGVALAVSTMVVMTVVAAAVGVCPDPSTGTTE